MSSSEYKVYYGEYSLNYWINMILNSEIILPPYQRDFVWSQEKVEKLVESLKEGQYIPPVIIGSYKDTEQGTEYNYVLDGQQRLSAVLLAWLGCFPKGKDFASNTKVFGNYNDDEVEYEDDATDETSNIKAWKFSVIQEKIRRGKVKKNELKEELSNSEQYYAILRDAFKGNDDFFESKKLGFSYIRAKDISDTKAQKRYFSTMFRNINISAVDLSPIESRSSLYWLDENIRPFLQPNETSMLGKIKVDTYDMDFARYMALLSQYKKQMDFKIIAKGFAGRKGKTIEQYIENYIYYLVDRQEQDEQEQCKFYIFDDSFNYEEAIDKLNTVYVDLDFPNKYNSIIEADFYLFGLIYFTIFENTNKKINDKNKLIDTLNKKIEIARNTSNHKKTPSALKYLRSRIEESIKIYENLYE